MSVISQILITLVAIEFFYIMYLETFVPSSKATGRVFKMSQKELANPTVQTLFKNQGIYNGLICCGAFIRSLFCNGSKGNFTFTANLHFIRRCVWKFY